MPNPESRSQLRVETEVGGSALFNEEALRICKTQSRASLFRSQRKSNNFPTAKDQVSAKIVRARERQREYKEHDFKKKNYIRIKNFDQTIDRKAIFVKIENFKRRQMLTFTCFSCSFVIFVYIHTAAAKTTRRGQPSHSIKACDVQYHNSSQKKYLHLDRSFSLLDS